MPGPVFLRGETVALRTIEDEDVPFLQETVNDPAVRHGLSASQPMTEQAEREWLESETGLESENVHLLVCVDGERVGTVGLMAVTTQPGNAEIGYFLSPEAWGNGYATDAVRTVVDYAFQARRLHRVYAKVLAGNDGSQRVLEKAGFEREGTLRDHWFRDGRHEDVYLYGLLADELDRGE
ncbi:N-acetyltransferase [Haloarcula mannanilytica]|uniref:N-acetyltransferase n=1 Tax=Haloarcula mannanilytica TaxID=2509225 RepID=A0A4C2EDI4_9EURY|nr:GNAT family protein [Haloarcula mannanilytica]GCF12364.1 N-acetyltransferase [Haloarcula mannanilytica]